MSGMFFCWGGLQYMVFPDRLDIIPSVSMMPSKEAKIQGDQHHWTSQHDHSDPFWPYAYYILLYTSHIYNIIYVYNVIYKYVYIYVCVYTWAKLSWPHCDLNGLIFSRNHPQQTTYFRLVIILNSLLILPRYTHIAGKVGVLFAEGHGNWLTIGESGGCYKWTTLSSMVPAKPTSSYGFPEPCPISRELLLISCQMQALIDYDVFACDILLCLHTRTDELRWSILSGLQWDNSI